MPSNTDQLEGYDAIQWPMTEERKRELILFCYPEIYNRVFEVDDD